MKRGEPSAAVGDAAARDEATPASDPRVPTARQANFALAVLFVVFVFNFIDRNIMNVLAEPIRRELGFSDAQVGWLSSGFAIFYVFAGIPLARWADRHDRTSLIAVGLAVWSGMTALCGAVRSFPQMMLARIGVGVGEASCTPAAHSLISDYFPAERRGRAFAIYGMGGSIGSLVGYLIGGHIAEAWGWRVAFLAVGLPGVLLALFVKALVREPVRGLLDGLSEAQPRPPVVESLRTLWRLRSLRHLFLGAGLHGFAIMGVSAFHGIFFMRVHGLGPADAATTLAMVGLFGTTVGSYSGGALCDRFGGRDLRWYLWLPALCTLVSIPFSALCYFWPGYLGAAVFCAVASGLGSFYSGPTVAMTQALAPLRLRALASAFFLFFSSLIGMGIGPVAVGYLSDGLEPRFGIDAVRYALLLVCFTNVWAAAHLFLGARSLRDEVAANRAGP